VIQTKIMVVTRPFWLCHSFSRCLRTPDDV